MKMGRAALFGALFCAALPTAGLSQDVTLTSRDGEVEIEGTLLGFDGEYYRLDTVYGELTVDGSGVTCAGPGCPSLQDYVADISVSGSAAIGSVLMPALIEGFAQRHGYQAERRNEDATHFLVTLTDSRTTRRVAVFRFRLTTSDEGFADLLANEADVVMSLREIRLNERMRALDAGMGDLSKQSRSRVLALDAILPIVSPQNPVREISPADLVRAFAGEIETWAELGGPDVPLSLHAPSTSTGLGQTTSSRLIAPAGKTLSPAVLLHDQSSDVTDAVMRDPFALGLASYAEAGTAQPLVLKGTCGRLLRAERRSVKTEDYPMTAPMFLYTPARRLPKIAREFLAFTRGPTAQIVIRRAGFVDQAPEEVPIDEQGDRFANAIAAAGDDVPLAELQRLVARLSPMKRLTTSFRFETGSSRLDAQSRSNVAQLAFDLEQGRFDARKLVFVGFSDGEGPADRNRKIAFERAEAVRDAVLRSAETADVSQIDLQVDAFGEAMPLACDNSAWGRLANRRVEIWVR